MEPMQLHARVGSDGVLRLEVPFEPQDAGSDVLVSIEPVRKPAPGSGPSWGGFLSETFGRRRRPGQPSIARRSVMENTADRRPPHLRFGIRSLLMLVVVCALAASAWRQWQQGRELATWRAKAVFYQQEIELRRGVADVVRKLNLKDAEHRRLAQLVGTMGPGDSLVRQSLAGQGSAREILVFHHDGTQCAGATESVALLFGSEGLVDYVIHNASDWHEARIEDGDRDGRLDVVYHCRTGSYSDPRHFTERYAIHPDGFQRVE